ncbi:Fur-regulated basic protein FbpA [Halobacillus salinarum]|uniref:Fur-regulated basic protein FbpA n=1 Tax=Halobacillus salinarum TaxID=2932257 RepID=UPI0037BE3984
MSKQLRKGLIQRRTFLIRELSNSHIYKNNDKQKLFDMTFRELEKEYSYLHRHSSNKQKIVQ